LLELDVERASDWPDMWAFLPLAGFIAASNVANGRERRFPWIIEKSDPRGARFSQDRRSYGVYFIFKSMEQGTIRDNAFKAI
jgi:hypothetical protein